VLEVTGTSPVQVHLLEGHVNFRFFGVVEIFVGICTTVGLLSACEFTSLWITQTPLLDSQYVLGREKKGNFTFGSLTFKNFSIDRLLEARRKILFSSSSFSSSSSLLLLLLKHRCFYVLLFSLPSHYYR
jgi:hypothetical protein